MRARLSPRDEVGHTWRRRDMKAMVMVLLGPPRILELVNLRFTIYDLLRVYTLDFGDCSVTAKLVQCELA